MNLGFLYFVAGFAVAVLAGFLFGVHMPGVVG